MCRLAALSCETYASPIEPILALETMKEGHDGSGLGLLLKDLGGDFEPLKGMPILSGVCPEQQLSELDRLLAQYGFTLVHEWTPRYRPTAGIQQRGRYFARAYKYPAEYKDKSVKEKEDLLLQVRLRLRELGENGFGWYVHSFYPDVIMFKEVGDPEQVAEAFGLDDSRLRARVLFAQGRQNTNYAIDLYACHPFFIQGFATMTNGENTAFVPIREFLMSRGVPGYTGYRSDSEVFTHILHYVVRRLGLPLPYYKDVITPLSAEERIRRPDAEALALLQMTLRRLCVDGPNCVIGVVPDGTVFMVQDTKKLRPGVVGGRRGKVGLASEVCGLDRMIPDRDPAHDLYPMRYQMVLVQPGATGVAVWDQRHGTAVAATLETETELLMAESGV